VAFTLRAMLPSPRRILASAAVLAPLVVLAGTLLPWFVAREVGEEGRPAVFGFASTPGLIALVAAFLACIAVAALQTAAARWSGILRGGYAALLVAALAVAVAATMGPWSGDALFDFTRADVHHPMAPAQVVGGGAGVSVTLAGAALGVAVALSWAVKRPRPGGSTIR
jgi:hypothetical protein